MSRWCGGCFRRAQLRASGAPGSINSRGADAAPSTLSRSTVVTGLVGSLVLSPLAWAQGSATRRRVPQLPAANLPHDGKVPGVGEPIRVVGIGESSVSGA